MKLPRISERILTDAVARTSPWLAPLPTAYLTFERTVEHLRWPWLVGLAAGLVVEGVGLSAINTALEFREHNQGLKDGDKRRAPYRLAMSVVGMYFISVIGLTVVLDTVPQIAQFAPLVFPALGACGTLIIAMRREHGRRVEQMILSLAAPYNKKAHRLRKAEIEAELAGAGAAQLPQEKPQDAKADAPIAAGDAKKTATIADWREICAGLDGNRADLRADDVEVAVIGAGLAPPSRRTMQSWAREAHGGSDEKKRAE